MSRHDRSSGFLRLVRIPAVALAALVAATAALATVSPAARDQVLTSLTARPTPYLVLAFDQPEEAVACRTRGDLLALDVRLTSHLDHTEDVVYVASLRKPTRAGAPSREFASKTDVASVAPGRTVPVRARLEVPSSGPYTVSVRLPEHDQRLTLSCRDGRDD